MTDETLIADLARVLHDAAGERPTDEPYGSFYVQAEAAIEHLRQRGLLAGVGRRVELEAEDEMALADAYAKAIGWDTPAHELARELRYRSHGVGP